MSEIICPDFCTVDVPAVEFSACSPVIRYGEISKIYVANPSQPLSDWSDLAAWTPRLDDSGTGDTKIRTLIVQGDMPVPESSTIEISAGRTVQGVKSRTVNFTIDDTSDTNLEAARLFDCGGTFLVWFETFDGQLIGGPDGIKASVNMNAVIPRSRNELQTITGTLKWKAKNAPERIASPMA